MRSSSSRDPNNPPWPNPERDEQHEKWRRQSDLRRNETRGQDFGRRDDKRSDEQHPLRLSIPPISAGAKPARPTYQISGPSRTLIEKKSRATVAITVAAAHEKALIR